MSRRMYIVLALFLLLAAAKASSAKQHADQVVELIHAQSLSRLKSDGIVPVQRLGRDGLPFQPPRYRHPPHMPLLIGIKKHAPSFSAAGASSVTQQTSAPAMSEASPVHKDEGTQAVVVILDENRRLIRPDIGRPSEMGHRQLVGMEDDGLVWTMDIPMTLSAPTVGSV